MTAAVTAVALLAVAAVAACDRDDGPSRAQFAEQANAICKQAAGEVESQAVPLFGPGANATREDVLRFLDEVVVPATRQQVARLRQLEPPRADREEFEEFVASAGRAVDALDKRVDEDPDSFFGEPANPFEEANAKAAAIGLEGCAGGAVTP